MGKDDWLINVGLIQEIATYRLLLFFYLHLFAGLSLFISLSKLLLDFYSATNRSTFTLACTSIASSFT